MLGQTDWGKVFTDLASIGATTAVTLKSKPWKTGQAPASQPPMIIEESSSSKMTWVIGGIAVVGAGVLLYSMLKKKRS